MIKGNPHSPLGESHQAMDQEITHFCWTFSYIASSHQPTLPLTNPRLSTRERAEYTTKQEGKASTLFFATACVLDWVTMQPLPRVPQYGNLFFTVAQMHNELSTHHSSESPDKTITAPRSKKTKSRWANPAKRKKSHAKKKTKKTSHFDLWRRFCIQDAIHHRHQNRASLAQIRLCQDKVRRLGDPVHSPSYKAVPTKESLSKT